MDPALLFVLALAVVAFGLVSRRIERTSLTPPMLFVAAGYLLGQAGWIPPGADHHLVEVLAELTLVLVLFSDASQIDLRALRRSHRLPVRLLLIGLPLTVFAGWLAARWLFPTLGLWEAALLAAILAPTDAALGQAVVSSPVVPERIRRTLSVESGLNDGLALPMVLLFLSTCASQQPDLGGAGYWFRFAVLQVTLGPLVGGAAGWLGARCLEWARRTGWINETFLRLAPVGLALAAYAGAELVGGNGFIAAFVAGLVFGASAKRVAASFHHFAEAEGQLATLLVFTLFGALVLPEVLPHAGASVWVYALASLTVVRGVPVLIALIGTGEQAATKAFLAWFGPRGIASLLFGLLVVEQAMGQRVDSVYEVVAVTVLVSVVLHGMTAAPGTRWLAARSKA